MNMVNGVLTLTINLNGRGQFLLKFYLMAGKMIALGEKIGPLGNKKWDRLVKMNALGNKNRDAW